MSRAAGHLGYLAFVLALSSSANAQPLAVNGRAGVIAVINVNLIPMTDEGVRPGQTVIVSGDRITAVGEAGSVHVPEGARVVDGQGRYLVPGLTDSHVHITLGMPWAPTRPDFGDAPLYLAYGVTTVVNLRGTPMQLDWRRRIEAGELVGPTIYTSGDFVNEPRVNTPDEVAREIAAQHEGGYDLIKFHEIFPMTTSGLSREAYRRMNDAAREAGIPLVGHAPVMLGLDAMLEARQPLAHLGALTNIYFLPMAGNRTWLLATAIALVTLMALMAISAGVAIVHWWRPGMPPLSRSTARVRLLIAAQLLVGAGAIACSALILPGGPLFDSIALRVVFTVFVLLTVPVTAALLASAIAMWRDPGTRAGMRAHAALASAASLVFLCVAIIFWLPVSWRSSDEGIERLAQRILDAGIPIQTTLVVYDSLGGPGWSQLIRDPAVDYLRADTRANWQRLAQAGRPGLGSRYVVFMKKVAGVLHRRGVTLIAGTDAMGIELVTPGSSLHHELRLLTESGFTPYEALKAATVLPARFLGKETEFGTIAPGQRADLILVDENPLDDISRLQQPAGVMARGRWFTREDLQQMLAALSNGL